MACASTLSSSWEKSCTVSTYRELIPYFFSSSVLASLMASAMTVMPFFCIAVTTFSGEGSVGS